MKLLICVLTFILFSLLPLSVSSASAHRCFMQPKDLTCPMKRVAHWQMEHFTYRTEGNLHDYGLGAWTNSVLYLGMLEWAEIADEPEPYLTWLMNLGEETEWRIPANFANSPRYSYYHADELCVGQFYLEMSTIYKDSNMRSAAQQRVDWIMENPADSSMHHRNKQSWTWCDALFMAPPLYAHLGQLTGNPAYLVYMHQNFLRTYVHLYDRDDHLFFRDDSYLDKREVNGEKVFWGRGNAWALAGIANILKRLPPESDIRPFYEKLFVELATRLSQLQSKDGFWHASLLDPDSYPSPETSATALITYGLAYGINNNLLNASTYRPVVQKAWEAMVSAIDEDGKIGWVQPIGADPKKVSRDMTAVYGAGAFLLAGAEILKLTKP